MLKMGIIKETQSEWSSPIVVVRKANGKIRLCLDARGLNEVTIKDPYGLHATSRVLSQLKGGCKYLSTLDLTQSFHQIALDEESQKNTAFTLAGRGQYMYLRLPFGLKNSSQCLTRLMDKVLGHDLEPFVFPYVDDIIIVSETFHNHLLLLEEVAKRLKSANLSINMEKSHFCTRMVSLLI